ncbi:hypothetical protein [Bradyrhizobium sp. SZCCHNPS1003]|nr:hypothetical protein [Bradyrhizobium sp. SZCCHNPS1003]
MHARLGDQARVLAFGLRRSPRPLIKARISQTLKPLTCSSSDEVIDLAKENLLPR